MAAFIPIRIIDDGLPPIPIRLALAWHASDDADPALRWFRRLVIERCSLLRGA